LDKAIFEASQHGEEKDRYIKVIQDISAKASQATGKVKEKTEKTGPKEYVASLEQRIGHYKLLSERTEDVVNVASLYYNEKMDKLGEEVRREQRAADARARERGTKEEKKDKKLQKEKVERRLEEDRRESKEQETEDETRRARKEKILETRREEEKGKTGTS
jgi:hypothetical protein